MVEKIAIVTGANKCLGFAVVKGLCRKFEGIVYLTARDETRGLDAVEKLKEIGLHPNFHLLDVTSKDSVKAFAEFINTKHGRIDVIVNNAVILDCGNLYPTYEGAKRNIDTNYKSLLLIEEHLYPLLRGGARVVNVSSACGHLSNLKNKKWISSLMDPNLKTERVNKFVDDYLESVKNETFDKNDFADDGKHAEHRVSKIALTALTKIQQRKYDKRNISINAVHPGYIIKDDVSNNKGAVDPDEAAKIILYVILEASPKLRGTFMWHDRKLIDWYDADSDFYYKCPW